MSRGRNAPRLAHHAPGTDDRAGSHPLINPGDGPESSDQPRPGDIDMEEAVEDNDEIGTVAGTDDEGATSPSDIEDEQPKKRS